MVPPLPQDDVDAGLVTSSAAVSAVSPSPSAVPVESRANETSDLLRASIILVEKTVTSMTSASGPSTEYGDAGNSKTFKIVSTSMDNTVLSQVVLTDGTFSDRAITCDSSVSASTSRCSPATNLCGGAIGCEATLSLIFSHVDTGETKGTAKVSVQNA